MGVIKHKRRRFLRMETKKEIAVKDDANLIEEWEKPSVKEMDVNEITLSGFTGSGIDGGYYS